MFPDLKLSDFETDQRWKKKSNKKKNMEEYLAKVMQVVVRFENMPGVLEAVDITGYDNRAVKVVCKDESVWDEMRMDYGPVKDCFEMGRGSGPGVCFVDGVEVFFELPKPDKTLGPVEVVIEPEKKVNKTEVYVIEVKDTYKDYPSSQGWVFLQAVEVYRLSGWDPLEQARNIARERQRRVMNSSDADAPRIVKSEYRIFKVERTFIEQN